MNEIIFIAKFTAKYPNKNLNIQMKIITNIKLSKFIFNM